MLRLFAAIIIAFIATPAWSATPWTMDASQSKLTFTAQQGDEKFTGGFKSFTAAIIFSADDLANSKITATVDMAGAYAGTPERDDALPGKDWFDIKTFPQAQFTTKTIKQTGPGTYLADAVLTIRGVSKNIQLPFTLLSTKDGMHAQGETTILRNDFGVGQGDFASDSWIKYDVKVGIDIFAVPGK